MKKRTVWFGNPVIVVRRAAAFGLLYWIVFYGGWKLILLLMNVEAVMELIVDRVWLFVVLLVGMFVGGMIFTWIGSSRIVDPMVRLQKLEGRMCFVCGYEIGEGLGSCSECGAQWDFNDLNRFWRWFALGKKG